MSGIPLKDHRKALKGKDAIIRVLANNVAAWRHGTIPSEEQVRRVIAEAIMTAEGADE